MSREAIEKVREWKDGRYRRIGFSAALRDMIDFAVRWQTVGEREDAAAGVVK